MIAANPAARALGVRPGEPVSAARALAPQLLLRPRDTSLEAATLAELAAWAGRFTPSVSLVPADAVLLDVAGSLRLFDGLEALVARLESGLAELGIEAALAAAPTPLAAHWLACTHPGTLLQAYPAWSTQLDALPLEVLATGSAVTPATLEFLAGIGIRRIGELGALPREGLARRQAGEVLTALARARGEQADPRAWFAPPARHEGVVVLPVATSTTEPLLFATSRLVAGLCAWLDGLQAGTDRFTLHLEHERGEPTALEIICGQPCRDAARLMLLARERLAVLPLPAAVEALRLYADGPVARPGHTPDLFGDGRETHENASLLLDRLRARLGTEAVSCVQAQPDHRPERASQHIATRPRAAQPTVFRPGRPAWLLDCPRPLSSLHGLKLMAGPERIESGWWDGADIRREYFVARTQTDALWWVFRDLGADGRWYVHGYFG